MKHKINVRSNIKLSQDINCHVMFPLHFTNFHGDMPEFNIKD